MSDPNVEPASPSLAEELETATSYRLVRQLAKGGMGDVFVVEHKELGTELVMKVIRSQLADFQEELTRRLRTEARLMVSMSHVNLVRVTDFGFTPSGRAYLVTELLEGETLGAYANRLGTLPLAEAVDITRQVLRGLGLVHAKGLVHRDIKPDNLFLATSSEGAPVVKILDFGIAKLQSAEAKSRIGVSAASTKEGTVLGTPRYFAPEQAMAKPVDARTDLYSVGCVFYRLVAGRPPFVPERSAIELYEKHILETPLPPSAYAPKGLSQAVDAFVLRALAKKKEDRYASADEMLAALDHAANEFAHASTAPLQGASAASVQSTAPVVGVAPARSAQVLTDVDSDGGTVYEPSTAPSDHARSERKQAQSGSGPVARVAQANVSSATAPLTTSAVSGPVDYARVVDSPRSEVPVSLQQALSKSELLRLAIVGTMIGLAIVVAAIAVYAWGRTR